MPIQNRPDPEYVPETQFDSFEDGKYPVTGIKWITTEDDGAPCFVTSKGIQPLVARFRTILTDENDGPPGSVSPAEVVMLVKAFGGDISKLPDREEDPTAYLIAARDQINNADKVVAVTVSGGWISNIPGMNLPPDTYFTFRYGGIKTKDEEGLPTPKEGKFGRWFGVDLIVDGDLQQRATRYDGYPQFSFVSYGLVVSEDGTPEYETRSKQGTSERVWTSSAVQFSKFIAAFAPNVEQMDFADVNNILPEVDKEAKRNKRRAVAQVVRSKNGSIGVNIGSLASIDAAPLPMPDEDTPVEKPARNIEEEVPKNEGTTMEQIYALIDNLAGGEAFDKDGNLSAKGKAWCRDNLKEFLKSKGYSARFDSWTEPMQQDILAHLQSLGSAEEDEF